MAVYQSGMDASKLFQAADAALYRAKEDGRNLSRVA
ncbi:diguanylate cyclase [Novosphingobium sp. MBES04]|nr:diguanylate cyclase [Novosphingobium sp. MBES04]